MSDIPWTHRPLRRQSEMTYQTVKAHGIKPGDIFTYGGRNAKGVEKGQEVIWAEEGNGKAMWIFNIATHKEVTTLEPNTKIWAKVE